MAKKTVEIAHEETGVTARVFPASLNAYERNGWKQVEGSEDAVPEGGVVGDEDKEETTSEEVENSNGPAPAEVTDSTETDNGNSTTDDPIRGSAGKKWQR